MTTDYNIQQEIEYEQHSHQLRHRMNQTLTRCIKTIKLDKLSFAISLDDDDDDDESVNELYDISTTIINSVPIQF